MSDNKSSKNLLDRQEEILDAALNKEFTNLSADDKNIAMLSHLLAAFFVFIPPLVLWFMYKDQPDKEFVIDQITESLNFQITIAIAMAVSGVLTFIFIGILLAGLLVAANFVLCIAGAVVASKGIAYRYPFALRLLK